MTAAAQIDWLLRHPATSPWLKQALSGLEGQDPVTLMNDLSLLSLVVERQAMAAMERALAVPD
ncbi:MAG: hypothetical protein ACRCSO_13150 [Sphingomonas sp.]